MDCGPLSGLRVLDLTRLLPGAYCSLILGELGAEVVKLEDPHGGDYLRLMPPLREGLGGAFYALNRGKRSVCIDLKKPAGRELFLRLLPGFRVMLEGFRPGVLQRLGLAPDLLFSTHPGLILCSISGYGQDGPRAGQAGHDLTYMALGGTLAQVGEPGAPPSVSGFQLADLCGGALWAAVRILAALRQPGGSHLDVSMTEGAMSLLLPWLGELAFGGRPQRRATGPLTGGAANYRCYRTRDGRSLAVAALEPKFWLRLCALFGLPGRSDDPVAGPERQEALARELGRIIGSRTLDEWQERLAGADVCVEPVLEIEELFDEPMHRDRGCFYLLHDPERGAVPQLRLPHGGQPAQSPAPRQGQHTVEILTQAGLSPGEIQALRDGGVVR